MPTPKVFFFDRVSRGALNLACASRDRGAVVVFEPSGIRDERLFHEAINLSDVVKYSHERLGRLRSGKKYNTPVIEIETFGSEGLRYRSRNGSNTARPWKEMAAYLVRDLRDAAGAGDWCTAGIIHVLASKGAKGLKEASAERIESALQLGQALAAIKCRHEGARGPMYALSKKQLEAAVKGVLQGETLTCAEEETNERWLSDLLEVVCPSCDTHKGGRSAASMGRDRMITK
ncbi:MAG: hypothetical protein PHE84_01280 [bacterium]|nr:hypothetical protein [bacterium]